MAEFSGFFNTSAIDPREYNASEFAEYFHNFISNGVFSKNNKLGLRVSPGTGLNVNIDTGDAYIMGYRYKNDSTLSKAIQAPDTILNRIDRVVLRFDEVAKEIKAVVKTGSFGSSPTAPSLENTATIKELSLARVIVNNKATTVSVIDERLTEFCGQVALLIDVPLDDLLSEWSAWKAYNEQEFRAWLVMLENALEGNTAGNLLNQINTKMDKSKITISNLDADASAMSEGDIWIKYT